MRKQLVQNFCHKLFGKKMWFRRGISDEKYSLNRGSNSYSKKHRVSEDFMLIFVDFFALKTIKICIFCSAWAVPTVCCLHGVDAVFSTAGMLVENAN